MTIDGPRLETAPSRLRGGEPVVARYAGGIGWGLVVLGLTGVVANRAFETPRLLIPSEGWGWLLVLLGVTLAMTHAAVETDRLMRRILGGIGVGLIAIGIGWGIAMALKERSWALGLVPALPGLFLLVLHIRTEEDAQVRRIALQVIGGVGLFLCLVGVLGTGVAPQWLPPRFSIALALGLLLTLIYLGFSGVTDDLAYRAALGLGGLGALTFVGALARAIAPTVVYDWRNETDSDQHLIAFAAGLSLVILGVLAMRVLAKPAEGAEQTDANRSLKKWGRMGALVGGFLIVLGVLRYFAPNLLANANLGGDPPRPYLVPTGFVLMIAGLVYALIAIGFISENKLVVMTRREITAYFVSPVAYAVMIGFVLMAAQAYQDLLGGIRHSAEQQQPLAEPIVHDYVISLWQVIALMAAVSLLTMRLFAEEKRSGTLEVLLTAPVSDWLVVLSKFIAAWLFFMLLWVPWWLNLLALRLEGGQEFDFRPMFAFFVAMASSGAAFMAMGMFFSSVTRDQIISAVLTFMGMAILVGFLWAHREFSGTDNVSVAARAVIRALSFLHMWLEAIRGKLYIRDVVSFLGVAVFWVFATVKVLEVRRWS